MAKSNRVEDEIARRKAVAARLGVRLLTQAEVDLRMQQSRDADRAGRDQARVIAALVKDLSAAGWEHALKAYLQEHPVTVECVLWLLSENRRLVKSQAQRKAANARHAETNEMKERAISFYLAKKDSMTKDEAAKAFTSLEPVRFRTVRNWLIGL